MERFVEREEYDLGSLVHEQSMCIVSHPIRIFFFFVKTIEKKLTAVYVYKYMLLVVYKVIFIY